ncbi:hypothetical protein D3C85_1871410 [compost metagenome]
MRGEYRAVHLFQSGEIFESNQAQFYKIVPDLTLKMKRIVEGLFFLSVCIPTILKGPST